MAAPLLAGAKGSNESTCDLHGTVLSIGLALYERRKKMIFFFQIGRRQYRVLANHTTVKEHERILI